MSGKYITSDGGDVRQINHTADLHKSRLFKFCGEEDTLEVRTKKGMISTVAAKAVIRDWETGAFGDETDAPTCGLAVASAKSELTKASLKNEVVRLSTRYNIASELTSFVAVEYRSPWETKGVNPPMDTLLQSEEGPLSVWTIDELKSITKAALTTHTSVNTHTHTHTQVKKPRKKGCYHLRIDDDDDQVVRVQHQKEKEEKEYEGKEKKYEKEESFDDYLCLFDGVENDNVCVSNNFGEKKEKKRKKKKRG
eukprot:GHVR01079272.1.p1 GENE.GHVR01079272.1~~GHVR01079272.1.p1  ORF type:complete len:252 (-),score=103.25 GHVR01079272.1:200-955(-)